MADHTTAADAAPPAVARPIWAYVALTATVLFWSGNFIAGRSLRGEIDPAMVNFIRWGVALLLFLPLAAPHLRRGWRVGLREWRYLLALGALGVAMFQTFVYTGLTATPVFNALLVIATTPAILLIWTSAIDRVAPRPVQMVGIGLSMAGAALMIAKGDLGALARLELYLGDLWIAAAALAWSAYTLMLRQAPPDLETWTSLSLSMVAGWVLMIPFALWSYVEGPPPLGDWAVWARILYIAVFASILAFVLWGYGVRRVGPVRAGQFINLMPIFGGVLAVVLLGETLRPYHLAGAALAFGGVWLVNRRG
ncbi:MAG: DMT family transporter [Rhodobacteraceae bacterium]|nr:DMT family transporter [Paracoccaceae bacterium]